MSRIFPARTMAIVLSASALLLASGCGSGSGEDETSQVDIDQLTVLAGKINRISKQSDAAGFCGILAPSQIKDTFISRSRCTSEYEKIFASIQDPQPATLENISVDGDTAQVTFQEQDLPVNFVKEEGAWWLGVDQGAGNPTGAEGSGAQG